MPGSFSSLQTLVKKDINLLNKVLLKVLRSDTSKKNFELLEYGIVTGGKRIRPILMILCARLLGGDAIDIVNLAAGVEILHNYTLIIDDVIDNSPTRRGNPTVWKKYGTSIAQCVSIDYAASLMRSIASVKNAPQLSAIYSRLLKNIVDGEIEDILMEKHTRIAEPYIRKNHYSNSAITVDAALSMIANKTASLFEGCCEIASVASSATPRQTKAMKKFGYNLGISFQITDDLLDIIGGKSFGKKIGQDISEGKRGNIVIAYAMNNLSSSKRKKLQSLLGKKVIDKKSLENAIMLLNSVNAINSIDHLRKRIVQKAKRELAIFPESVWKKSLMEIADLVNYRSA